VVISASASQTQSKYRLKGPKVTDKQLKQILNIFIKQLRTPAKHEQILKTRHIRVPVQRQQHCK